jgi:hypothetical protein
MMDRKWIDGFRHGYKAALADAQRDIGVDLGMGSGFYSDEDKFFDKKLPSSKKKRKLSKWQKFVKAKSKLPRFKYKTGKRKGMVNMKAVAAAWKKVPKSKK